MINYDKEIQHIITHVKNICFDIPYDTHHIDHIMRVYNLSKKIGSYYNINKHVLYAAALLHDIGRFTEDSTTCHAEISAQYADNLLNSRGWENTIIKDVCYAISTHRYSKGIKPITLEAQILQDCDRIDALGAIGISRVISYDLETPLYDIQNPLGDVETKSYRLNHFYTKILGLKDTMHTDEAKIIAEERTKFIVLFLEQFKKEVILD